MTQPAPSNSWPRSKYMAGGGNPRIFYKVQGSFAPDMQLSPRRYGGAGIPSGCSLQSYDQQRHADVLSLGLSGVPGQHLRQVGDALLSQISKAPKCLVLRGEIADPDNFDYFRDAIGLILSALDGGGLAVYDPLLQAWWTAEHWRKVALSSAGFVPRAHTTVLVDEDDNPERRWVHTRGLAKFGRPDISVRELEPELVAPIQDLCAMLINTLAHGTVLADGQELQTDALPGAWQVRYSGYTNDPEFNNVHFDVRRIS